MFDNLVQEASHCDRPFNSRRRKQSNKEHIKKVFTRLMLFGKIRSAIRWLPERTKGGVLNPKDFIQTSSTDRSLMPSDRNIPLLFPLIPLPCLTQIYPYLKISRLQGLILMQSLAEFKGVLVQVAVTPHWQDILGTPSHRLCDSIADFTRKLSNSLVDWPRFQALLSNRLIALDKSPRVRPIRVGETLQCIIGKAVCLVSRSDAEEICAPKQLCAGLKYGVESAIHAVSDLYDSHDDSYGLLIVDAKNTFNTINRSALLWNVSPAPLD